MGNLWKHFLFFVALGLVAVCTVRADEWDKRTIVTINQPVEVPNQVLEPGTYVFKLLNSPSDRHIVQIFDKDEKHLITTILAIPNYRLEPTGKTQITFWERQAGTPSAIRAWFYPGDNFGQEFAYPPNQAAQIAAYSHQPVVTTTAKSDEYAKAPVTSTPPEPAPAPTQAEPAPAPPPPPPAAEPAPPPAQTQPEQEPAPAPEPQPAPAPAPSELPHTASNAPLIGLLGIFALIGSVVAFLAPVRFR